VFNASHFLIDARLADDCSDYFCNKTSPHKPSDPSHQVSFTADGGRSFTPLWLVGGSSPWSAGVASRPFLGPCTLPLNSTTQLALYQGQVTAPWESLASVFTLNPISGLRWGLAERAVRYRGVGDVCGAGHMWNQGVIAAPAGSAGGWLLSAECTTTSTTKTTNALIFTSADGYDWDLRSAVPVESPPGSPPCESPGENTLVQLDSGASSSSLLLVARCGSGQQLLAWVSTDAGVTWKRHELPLTMRGVMPVAVRMDSGSIVLATGRGGLALWLNEAGDGKDWGLTNVGATHNDLIMHNNKLNGSALQYTDAFVNFNVTYETTAYVWSRASPLCVPFVSVAKLVFRDGDHTPEASAPDENDARSYSFLFGFIKFTAGVFFLSCGLFCDSDYMLHGIFFCVSLS
jgi:hypothetical protein